MINRFFVAGNVATPVQVRTTSNGTKVATIRIAVNSGKKNDNGEYIPDFFAFEAFGNMANVVERYTVGSNIAIEASIHNNNYVDKNGNKVYRDTYYVNSVHGSIKQDGAKAQQQNSQQAVTPQQQTPQQQAPQQTAPFGNFQQQMPQQATPQRQTPFGNFQQTAAPQQQAPFGGFQQSAPMNAPVNPINPQDLFADFNSSNLTDGLPFN